jgi:hypothetical protein
MPSRQCESCRYWNADELVGVDVIDHDPRNPYKDGKAWQIIGAGVCHRRWGVVDSLPKPEGREMLSGYIEPNSHNDCRGYRRMPLKKARAWFRNLDGYGWAFLLLVAAFFTLLIFGKKG